MVGRKAKCRKYDTKNLSIGIASIVDGEGRPQYLLGMKFFAAGCKKPNMLLLKWHLETLHAECVRKALEFFHGK
jgi:hypothetical protein